MPVFQIAMKLILLLLIIGPTFIDGRQNYEDESNEFDALKAASGGVANSPHYIKRTFYNVKQRNLSHQMAKMSLIWAPMHEPKPVSRTVYPVLSLYV